jgi:hypothetical protein
MKRSVRRKSIRLWFAVSLLALFCSGCLRADIFEFFSYDAATDTFRFLQLDLNIMNDEPSDLDHLVELWNERDRVIPQPAIFRLWSLPALLRVDASHLQAIDLAKMASQPPATVATDVPLDSIKIEPGKFFYTQDRTLCYYQQVTCSGKIVDRALALANEQLASGVKEVADKEIKRRAAGGKPISWDEFRAQQLPPSSNQPQVGGNQQQQNKEGLPLDDASLAQVSKAATDGQLKVHRNGVVLSLGLPLSAADCQEAQKTMDVWRQRVGDVLKQSPGRYEFGLSAALESEIAAGDQFVVKIDLLKFTKMNEENYPLKTAPGSAKLPENPTKPLETHFSERSIATLQKNSIPIEEKLTAKEVVEGFLKGK